MSNIVIDAIITTVGPLSITMPVAAGGRANQWNNFPVTANGMDDDGNLQMTGYLPATTVRGMLRRAAGIAAMAGRGEGKTTLQQAYADILGQGSDTKDEVDLVKLAALRQSEPILDLFGSWSLKSRLLVSNFLPQTNVLPLVVTGVRKDLEDTDGVLEQLAKADQDAYFNRSDVNSERAKADAVVKGIGREIAKTKKAGGDISKLEADKTAAEQAVATLKEQMGEMANSSRTITEYYALPTGLLFSGRIVIQNAKDRDIALVMDGLEYLSQRPVLGGQVARGCGEVKGVFTFKKDGKVLRTVTSGGWASATVAEFSQVELAKAAA